MRRATRPLLIVIALGAATLLSGCVVIAAQTAQQLGTIGAVRLSTTVCFSLQPGCPDTGNTGYGATHGGFQVMLGYRIPQDTSAPQAFNTTTGQFLSFESRRQLCGGAAATVARGSRPEMGRLPDSGPRLGSLQPDLHRRSQLRPPPGRRRRAVRRAVRLPGRQRRPGDARETRTHRSTAGRTRPATTPTRPAASTRPRSPMLVQICSSRPRTSASSIREPPSGLAGARRHRCSSGSSSRAPAPAPAFSLKASTDIPGASAKAQPSSVTPSRPEQQGRGEAARAAQRARWQLRRDPGRIAAERPEPGQHA